MVRFARAEGSLGCNKRVLEEATPWAEIVAQRGDVALVHASKKRKEDTKDADIVEKKKKKKRCKTVDEHEVNAEIAKSKSHQKQKKINEIKESIEYIDSDQHTGTLPSNENSGEKEKQKKKKKKKKENSAASPKVEFVINAKGQRVKVFKDGTERTWFDLPYEENERMTRYDNMWVKKEMVNKLDELKATLKDQGLGEKEIMRQMMKAKRKAHRELRIELIYEQKRLVNEQQNGGDIMEMDTLQETSAKKKDKKKKEKKKISARQDVCEMDVDEVSDINGTEMIGGMSSQQETVAKKRKEKKKSSASQEASEMDVEEVSDTIETEMMSGMSSQQETVAKKRKEKKRESGSAKQEVSEMGRDEVNGTDRSEMISGMSRLEETETVSEKKVDKKKKHSIKQGLNWDVEGKCNNTERTEVVSQEETLTKIMDKKRKEKKKKCDSVIQGVNDVDELNDTDKKYIMASEVPLVQGHNHHEEEEQEQYEEEQEQDTNPSTYDKCLFSSKGHSLFTEGEKNLKSNKNIISFEFQEDDLMTNYEGYWVMREGAERLNSAKKQKLQAILDNRTNGSTARDLTREESIAFQRAMKKEKRFEHRKLIRELVKQAGGKRQQNRKGITQKMHADPHPRGNSNKSDVGDIVRFDGFWVKKESADRLTKLREKLRNEGVSEEELKVILQKERRKEERLLKNERQLVCLKCRKPGHMVSACPELQVNDSSAQVDICYTCGSTEHTSRGCTLKKPGSEFSLATCYICGESGHISRQCPDNPRGLYPNGGACRGCGSVEHLARDCPDLKEEQEKVIIKADRMDEKQIEALETQHSPHPSPSTSQRKVKKIKF